MSLLICLRRAANLTQLDQKEMLDIRTAWFEEVGGPPTGNKCKAPIPFKFPAADAQSALVTIQCLHLFPALKSMVQRDTVRSIAMQHLHRSLSLHFAAIPWSLPFFGHLTMSEDYCSWYCSSYHLYHDNPTFVGFTAVLADICILGSQSLGRIYASAAEIRFQRGVCLQYQVHLMAGCWHFAGMCPMAELLAMPE